jgi:hypothetical protein
MFTAYFDESGIHGGSLTLSVAGYLSSDLLWGQFEEEWQSVLNREGLPYFHMVEFENRQGYYRAWDEQRRHSVLRDLFGIIQRNTIIPIASSLKLEDARFLDDYQPPNSPYTFCVQECMKKVGQWAWACGYSGNVAYVFEHGAGYGNELDQLRKIIAADETRKRRLCFGSWVFGDKKEILPLQAADILAYESYKEMLSGVVPDERQRPTRTSLRLLLSGTAHQTYCRYVTQESFLGAIRHGKIEG